MKTEIKLIATLLNDDHGISQESWEVLVDWMLTFSAELADIVAGLVDATDDRYYVKEGKVQELQDQLEDYVRKTLVQEL